MKAARIYSFGDSHQIKVEDSPQPTMREHEVLVQVHDAGINPIDWKIREGFMKQSTDFPMTLGQDFSGDVVKISSKFIGFEKDDRVFGFAKGSYAEFATASMDKIALIPDGLDYETAAAIPTPGLTALQLIEKARLQKDLVILVHGGAGAVGSIACQLALAKKASVIATASDQDLSYLRELGVQKIIDYKTQRFEEFAKNVDVVIDLVGGETLTRSYQIMKKGGLALSTVGSFKEDQAAKFGISGENFFMQQNSKDLEILGRLFAERVLKTRVSDVLSLEDAPQAQDLSQKGHAHGKVLLRMM